MAAAVATNWIAITGAPSSGKTSIIDALAGEGYKIQVEVARAYIEEKLAAGLTLEEIRGPGGVQEMQRQILARKLAMEQAQDPDEIVFMDRGLPDSIAYYRKAGLDVQPVLDAAALFQYRAVFILDRLPVKLDDVRLEDDAAAQQLDEMFEADYTKLGYSVVRVPIIPVTERANWILRHLGLPPLQKGVARALSTGGGIT